ncbi:DivIVA domain-containing protein [Micromonospora halotolerans]|uniref:DivIVA domain-containing protein n=1 Tax=Micromonospora halotolerans TaxID=709879 RepID=A0ABZ0A1V2_9ACTN|nr:DivIVA domain-containing protein [Micromonospora halotolerans]WNM41348.1 DivIVA domain-containing protein [Micromonospora halotolerans]
MGEVLLLLVVALTVAAVVFGVTVLVSGRDPGLAPAEPDGRAVPLPGSRPLDESDVAEVRFDTALRGYRMAQVDAAMRRAAYDIGYKTELIGVLEAENAALREGRTEEADALRRARAEAAATGSEAEAPTPPLATAPPPATTPPAAGAEPPTAEAGVAEAPAAAAVEDMATLPSAAPAAATGGPAPVAPVATPVDQTPPEVGLRPPTDPTDPDPTARDDDPTADTDSDRERGPVVRSESA